MRPAVCPRAELNTSCPPRRDSSRNEGVLCLGAQALGHISKDLLRKCYLLLGSQGASCRAITCLT